MAELSNYLEDAIINLMRSTNFTGVAAYVTLYTTDPTDADTGTEVSGGGYARQLAGLSAPSDGVSSNASDTVFPTATADWGTITHLGLRDAATLGNLLLYSILDASKAIATGDTFKMNAGELKVTLA